MRHLLEVSHLSVSFAGRDLISDISFTLDQNQRLALIGESGSGKSLTALAIIGLLPEAMTARGSIRIADGQGAFHEIIGASEWLLNTLRGNLTSVVFQEPTTALDPLMRIGHQIAYPLRRQGLRGTDLKGAVLQALDEVSINNPERISNSLPHEISGGERQRVAIAMALACKPAILIADEPTTALDVTVQAEVLELISTLTKKYSMGLLFISHDLAVVKSITDSVHLLKDGEIVESGSLESILKAPKSPYSQELVESANRLDGALDAIAWEKL
jgi:peptide/nickel transport system ATP-binding protein